MIGQPSGEMALCDKLGITRYVSQEIFSRDSLVWCSLSHNDTINPLLTKLVHSIWLDNDLVLFLHDYGPRLRR